MSIQPPVRVSDVFRGLGAGGWGLGAGGWGLGAGGWGLGAGGWAEARLPAGLTSTGRPRRRQRPRPGTHSPPGRRHLPISPRRCVPGHPTREGTVGVKHPDGLQLEDVTVVVRHEPQAPAELPRPVRHRAVPRPPSPGQRTGEARMGNNVGPRSPGMALRLELEIAFGAGWGFSGVSQRLENRRSCTD
jgi:hypothetical protein